MSPEPVCTIITWLKKRIHKFQNLRCGCIFLWTITPIMSNIFACRAFAWTCTLFLFLVGMALYPLALPLWTNLTRRMDFYIFWNGHPNKTFLFLLSSASWWLKQQWERLQVLYQNVHGVFWSLRCLKNIFKFILGNWHLPSFNIINGHSWVI